MVLLLLPPPLFTQFVAVIGYRSIIASRDTVVVGKAACNWTWAERSGLIYIWGLLSQCQARKTLWFWFGFNSWPNMLYNQTKLCLILYNCYIIETVQCWLSKEQLSVEIISLWQHLFCGCFLIWSQTKTNQRAGWTLLRVLLHLCVISVSELQF